jgi:hypothetical protein
LNSNVGRGDLAKSEKRKKQTPVDWYKEIDKKCDEFEIPVS